MQHNSEPRYQLDFNKENPVEVDKEVADFIIETTSSGFEIVKSKKSKEGE